MLALRPQGFEAVDAAQEAGQFAAGFLWVPLGYPKGLPPCGLKVLGVTRSWNPKLLASQEFSREAKSQGASQAMLHAIGMTPEDLNKAQAKCACMSQAAKWVCVKHGLSFCFPFNQPEKVALNKNTRK